MFLLEQEDGNNSISELESNTPHCNATTNIHSLFIFYIIKQKSLIIKGLKVFQEQTTKNLITLALKNFEDSSIYQSTGCLLFSSQI